jgi:hypothetical protein
VHMRKCVSFAVDFLVKEDEPGTGAIVDAGCISLRKLLVCIF